MEVVKICCLKGVGHGTESAKIISLDETDEVTIGRSDQVTVPLLSNMISRKHCILKKEENNDWSITDNKSLNGVVVNDKRLQPMIPHILAEGDRVQLGMKDSVDKEEPFVWVYHRQQRVKLKKNFDDSPIVLSQSSGKSETSIKRKGEDFSPGSVPPQKKKNHNISSPVKSVTPHTGWSPSTQLKSKMAEHEKLMEEKLAAQEEKLAQMQAILLQNEKNQEQLQQELLQKEMQMKGELKRQQEEMEEQKRQYEETLRRRVEEQLKEKEECLRRKLESEKQKLIEEKKKIEESIKEELQAKLGEKDKDLQKRLEREMERLETVIQKKECEQKLLSTELVNLKAEQAKQKEDVWKTKEDILTNFSALMETELQCSICNELFVQATSLNCAHSYCALCIEQWTKVKKECPVCRSPITSHMRSIVLDSYIDKMVEQLSDEMKERRKTLVEERKADQQKREMEKQQAGGRGRGRARRGRGRRGGARGRAATEAPTTAPVDVRDHFIDISGPGEGVGDNANMPIFIPDVSAHEEVLALSEDSSQSTDMDEYHSVLDSDSEESVEGVPGTYYGGYGSCFRCGSRGHWANGCPFFH